MRAAAPRGRGGSGGRQARRPARRLTRGPASHADPPPAHASERLQKLLSRAGVASRREVEAWIRAGRLTVNGEPATLGARAGAGDRIRLDGRLVHAREGAPAGSVFLCHRSPGEPLAGLAGREATATPALLERLPRRSGRRFIAVSPMPGIDGGLELVSSDGELAAKLQRAVRSLSSEFAVRVRGELSDAQLESVRGGVLDGGVKLAVERCESAGGHSSNRWYTLTARGASGKQARALFERAGALVSRVLRTKLGPLLLERSLARGRFRELSDAETRTLLAPDMAAATDSGGGHAQR
jgi:23S rRNA pseudouridine2605 synthase